MQKALARLGSVALPPIRSHLKWQVPASLFHNCDTCLGMAGKPKGLYEFPDTNADFDVSTAEWEYVERLFPRKFIPKPNVPPGTTTPSGWVAPSATENDYPYFVTRNENHLFRIHKKNDILLLRIMTIVKGIEGDVFALGDELREYLLKLSKKRVILLRVHEAHGVIIIKGDFVDPVEKYLLSKGF